MSSTSRQITASVRRSARSRTILTGLALAALPVPVLLSACTSAEPQGEAARVGEAEQLLTQCVTFQRGAGGTVSDAMLSFPPGHKNYGSHPLLRTGKKDQSLLWFDLSTIPEGAVIDSATLKLYTNGATGDTVSLHAATAAWSESTVTYNSFDNQYDPAVVGLIQPSSPNALKTVSLTSLVTDWVTGAKVNYGVLLKGTQNPPTHFWSSDSDKTAFRPALEVCFTTPDNHCDPDPCQNGATCVNNPTGYTCECQPGWTGTNCETNIDECAPENPCLHGGTCTDGVNGYTCACEPGWTGANCEIDIDECESNPCVSGECVDQINAYQCECYPGFTGTNCEINIDECAPENPCLNGGTCTDGVNGYTCACATGYTGANCEENIDDCPGNQCQNGGTCLDGVASYTCTCPPGFSGTYCETNIDECAPENPCLNGGSCTDGANGYTCACAAGYAGTNCEIDVNDCESAPCQNGGLCVDGVNSYTCTCELGWTGTNCETFVPCALAPCQNGGACVPTENAAGYVCACPIGWTGQDCDVQWDICASNLCQNGGTCTGALGEQSCVCPAGFEGPFCEQVIYDCAVDNPCTPTGTTTYFPTDKGPNQYIECSAGGECSQMTCPAGDKWDQSTLSCVTPTTCPCDANAGWSQVNAVPNGLIVTSSDPSNGSEARAYLTQGDPTYLGMGLLLPEDGVTMSYFDTDGGSNNDPVGACFIMSRPLQSYYAAWLTSTEAAICNAQIEAANTTNTPVPDVPVPLGLFGAGALGLAEIARRVIRRRSR